MLRELRIHNFAIIEDLALEFRDGLTVLTGETGAGKSILVDAVELIVGGRSSADLIRTGCTEAVLEASFTYVPQGPLGNQLQEMGLLDPEDNSVVIRRILSRAGKGRIYLNGGQVPLNLLQEAGEKLVDIHGQHEHQSLLKSEDQLNLLDAYGKLLSLRLEYERSYENWNSVRHELDEVRSGDGGRGRMEDLLRHQQEEIASARIQPNEEEELDKAKRRLAHSDRLIHLSSEAYEILYERDGAVQSLLSRVRRVLEELIEIDPEMASALSPLEAIEAHLDDLTRAVRAHRDQIEHEPDRLEEIEDRLHLIGDLKKKYGPTVEDVMASLSRAEEELMALAGRGERIQKLEQDLLESEKAVRRLADQLTRERTRVSVKLRKEVEKGLKPLGMEKAKFEVRFLPVAGDDGLTKTGAERVEFLIAPNPGEEPRSISRTASGGELSRLMLAIKAILCEVDPVPTLIFDEVDAGIGGGVAAVVGERLKKLAQHRQVFCITHLPQIAAYGSAHFAVEKTTDNGRTIARVASLAGKERVDEIARMLGGRKITPAVMKHAKEMLSSKGY
jgi:DNA repair protein RecN (Recombination protein N)